MTKITIEKAGDGRMIKDGDLVRLHVRMARSREAMKRGDCILNTYQTADPVSDIVGRQRFAPAVESALLANKVGTTFSLNMSVPERYARAALGGGVFAEIAVLEAFDQPTRDDPDEALSGHFGPTRALDDAEALRRLNRVVGAASGPAKGVKRMVLASDDALLVQTLLEGLGVTANTVQVAGNVEVTIDDAGFLKLVARLQEILAYI